MSDEVTRILQSADPLNEQDLAQVLQHGAARGGARQIARTRWPRPRYAGRHALSALGTCAAIAAGATIAVLSLSSSSTPSAEALSFSQRGEWVIARILNPFASVSEIKRELDANHLHVALKLVPASPGSVGKVVMIDVNGSPSSGIEPLLEGKCANGPCTVGVKVARDYKGTGYVVIGRAAKPGERYESTPIGGAFAPGEALHCSGLEGAPLKRAIAVLHDKRLAVVKWRTPSGLLAKLTPPTHRRLFKSAPAKVLEVARRRFRVQQIAPVAPGKVEVWLEPAKRTAEALKTLKALKRIRPFMQQSCRARRAAGAG